MTNTACIEWKKRIKGHCYISEGDETLHVEVTGTQGFMMDCIGALFKNLNKDNQIIVIADLLHKVD